MNNDSKNSIFRQESLERLSSPEQLDQLMQVVNARSWLALGALGSLVLLAIGWSIFGRIPITVTGKGILVHPTDSSDELIGLTYFDRSQGNRIQPGMEVMIVPDRSDRGSILGRVKAVSAASVTTLDAARQSGLSNALDTGAIEVLIELQPDATGNGYRQAASENQIELSPGMTTTARVLLAQKAPIAFAFPFLAFSVTEASR